MDGTGVDLNVFKFPYFATWYAFFMNSKGYIYARYGENWGKLEMTSVSGLKTVMKNVLEVHKKEEARKPDPPLSRTPLLIESLP